MSEQVLPCPRCGRPTIHRPTPPDGWLRCEHCVPAAAWCSAARGQAMQPQVVTIERTGKAWKGRMLLGGTAALAGIALAASGQATIGVVLIVVGTIVYATGRFGAWWHHG